RAGPAFFATPPVGNRAARAGGGCLVLRPGLPYAGRGRGGEAGKAVIVKITREVLEGYLSCKYKGHLKLAGQAGTPSDYEAMMSAAKAGSREAALARLVARFGQGDACRGGPVTVAKLKQGAPLLAGIALEGEIPSLPPDALKRADGPPKLAGHHT